MKNNHATAREIFAEIQSRPFCVPVHLGDPSHNCYIKGLELLQRLGALGYTVRGRIGETVWPKGVVPAEIISLWPQSETVTHFYVEVLIDDKWKILDPTIQPSMASTGFPIGSWDNNTVCFPITKLYTQEENIAYHAEWENQQLQRRYFNSAHDFLVAFNGWLARYA
ncbi:MAG: hypothetical protein DI585_05935 [Pseudomonas fluorescens]|nr:MAG: hypothetical protein DI585_05935 [Pseudomonas fluorescens]